MIHKQALSASLRRRAGPCVGVYVPHAAAGIGAIATQGDTNPNYGSEGLALLAKGNDAQTVMRLLTGLDAGSARRQLIIIGRAGPPALFTGSAAIPFAGAIAGRDFAVGGNMLAREAVLDASAAAFEASREPFAERLLAAMAAGEAAGGDTRGIRSAALRTYTSEAYPQIDCRVDLSDHPLNDLAHVLETYRSGEYAAFVALRPRRAAPDAPAIAGTE